VQEVTWSTFLSADFEKEHGFPHIKEQINVLQPEPGWYAIGLTYWKERHFGLAHVYDKLVIWPDRIPPLEKVGKSIYVWHFPAGP
jgi:hypothetical protein